MWDKCEREKRWKKGYLVAITLIGNIEEGLKLLRSSKILARGVH